jgi:PD-(D/E)XK nuclease superfamily
MDEFWLDNSKVETFHLCPQKYEYRYEEHLVPIDRKRDNPLMFGGAIHRALESLYRGTGFDSVPCPLGPCARCEGQPIPNISAVFLSNYTDDPNDPKEIRTVDRGLDLLAQYLMKWRREPFKVIAVEVPFELEWDLRVIKFKYIGRIDLIAEQDGIYMPVDHKTTTRFGMVFDSSFKLSGQFTGYMRATEQRVGQPVYTALANALRVTTRIEDASFARIYTSRTPEEFDIWEENVRDAARQITEMRAARFWPRHAPFACGAYNRVCEYYPLCIASAQTREILKKSAYEVIPWEPRKDADE